MMPMLPLQLVPKGAEVVERTLDAVDDSLGQEPELVVRCRSCHTKLAFAGSTEFGPLFTSTWTEPLVAPIDVNGEPALYRTEARRRLEEGADVETEGDFDVKSGSVALLALPESISAPEYPALVVRCNRHGWAVLSRTWVLNQLAHRVGTAKVRLDDQAPALAPTPSAFVSAMERRYGSSHTSRLSITTGRGMGHSLSRYQILMSARGAEAADRRLAEDPSLATTYGNGTRITE